MAKKILPRLTDTELSLVAAVLLCCVDGWNEHDYGPQTPAERAIFRAYDAIWAEGERRHGSDEFAEMRDAIAREKGLSHT